MRTMEMMAEINRETRRKKIIRKKRKWKSEKKQRSGLDI